MVKVEARVVMASIPITVAAGRLERGEVGGSEGGEVVEGLGEVVEGLGEAVEDKRLVELVGFLNEW